MIQIRFEMFNTPAFYVVGLSPILLLLSSGRATGIVMESGDGITSITPVSERFQRAITNLNFASHDINYYFQYILSNHCYTFTTFT